MVYPRIPQMTGNVISTATGLDNKVVRFDSTSGQIIQGSYVTIDDNGAISTPVGYGLGIGSTPTYLLQIKGTSTTDLPTYSSEFLDSANWTGTGVATDWTGSFATGFTHLAGNTATLSHDHAAVNSTKYQITYTVTGRTAGTFTITFGGQTSAAISATGAWGPTTTGTGILQITPTSTFDGTIVISIKSITVASTPILCLNSSNGTERLHIRALSVSDSVFIGQDSGKYNTTGNSNTSIGRGTLQNNTTGLQNTAISGFSLYNNTTGDANSAIGYNSLLSNTTGCFNIAFGPSALYSNTTGNYNCNIGYFSGYSNTTGVGNGFVGTNSGRSITSGSYNSGVGYNSGRTVTEGNYNTFSGYNAGYDANQKVDAANSMALGANTFTNRSNQVVIGDASVVETHLRTGVYIGSTSTTAHTQPTARLHIAAGTASASTAPIKLTSGSLMTATEDGTFEYDGANLYFSIGATRRTITVT